MQKKSRKYQPSLNFKGLARETRAIYQNNPYIYSYFTQLPVTSSQLKNPIEFHGGADKALLPDPGTAPLACCLPVKPQIQSKRSTCYTADNKVYCQQRTRKYEIFNLGFSEFKPVVQRHASMNSKLWGVKLNSYQTPFQYFIMR